MKKIIDHKPNYLQTGSPSHPKVTTTTPPPPLTNKKEKKLNVFSSNISFPSSPNPSTNSEYRKGKNNYKIHIIVKSF